MKTLNNFHLWFAFGVSLGAIMALQAAALLFDRSGDHWVYKYQTLIGALTTLVAAFLGALAILWQIEATREDDEARRAERLKGARAMLPFTAHDLQLHVEGTIEKITSILDKPPCYSDAVGERGVVIRTEFFVGYTALDPLPEAAFILLRELIELASLRVGREIAETLKEFQEFHASLMTDLDWAYERKAVYYTKEFLLARLNEQVQLYARVRRLMSYGSSSGEITCGRVSNEEFQIAGRRALGVHGKYLEYLAGLRN